MGKKQMGTHSANPWGAANRKPQNLGTEEMSPDEIALRELNTNNSPPDNESNEYAYIEKLIGRPLTDEEISDLSRRESGQEIGEGPSYSAMTPEEIPEGSIWEMIHKRYQQHQGDEGLK